MRWLLLLLLFCTDLVGGELRLLPEHPPRGASITVEYIPDSSRFAPGEFLWLYVYEFTEAQAYPTLQEVPLEYQRTTGKHGAAFRLDTATVYALCKVGNGVTFDTRRGHLWEIVPHEQGRPVRGALLRAALSRFGLLQEGGWQRVPDLWEAERLLQRVLQEEPNSFAPRIWLVAVQHRLGVLDYQGRDLRLRELLQQPYPEDEVNLRAVLWALGALRERRRMEALEDRILAHFPTWDLAREILFVRLNRAAVFQEYVATAERFLQLYTPEVPGYEEMYLALVRGFLQHDYADSIPSIFRRYPKVPAAAYAELAHYWLERRQTEKAEPWVRQMLINYNQQRYARQYRKPRYLSTVEWDNSNRVLHGLILATEARLRRQQKQLEEAIRRFQEAWSAYQEEVPPAVLEQLVEALRVIGQNKNAFSVCTQAILQDKASDTLWAHFRELFLLTVRNDSALLQQEMFRLSEQAAQLRRQRLWAKRLEWEAPAPVWQTSIVSPEGKRVRLDSLRGKIIVLDFWATWCRPCMESFPWLQKIWDSYHRRPDVAIVAINVWEQNGDRRKVLQDFQQNNPQWSIPLYADESDQLPVGFGVTAIPTQIVLDRHGQVQFRTVGYRSGEDFFRTLQDYLELLLQQ